jgi:hypothetical protein
MNIFEFACFVGLPSIVAFGILIGVQHAFRLSLAIGAGSAFVSLFAVILFSYVYRLLRRRRLEKAHVAIWAVLAVILSASVALYFKQVSVLTHYLHFQEQHAAKPAQSNLRASSQRRSRSRDNKALGPGLATPSGGALIRHGFTVGRLRQWGRTTGYLLATPPGWLPGAPGQPDSPRYNFCSPIESERDHEAATGGVVAEAGGPGQFGQGALPSRRRAGDSPCSLLSGLVQS